jgi:hypothetical protein
VAKKRKPRSRRPPPPPPPAKSRRPQLLVLAGAAIVGVLVAAGIAWLQDGEEPGPTAAPLVEEADPGPVHVHGLGVDPADGSLYIATHTGLWRARAGATRAERVGEGKQDTMGFSVVGRRHFVGSGHPDNPAEPPLLGLIESRDAGRTWRPISLYGEADFHVLRFGRKRLYGYDASNDRLLASGSRGRRWQPLEHPAPIADLAVAPDDDMRVLATTTRGLFASADGGRSWRRLSGRFGLLAWPRGEGPFLVGAGGDVLVSRDGGRRWTGRGAIGGDRRAPATGASFSSARCRRNGVSPTASARNTTASTERRSRVHRRRRHHPDHHHPAAHLALLAWVDRPRSAHDGLSLDDASDDLTCVVDHVRLDHDHGAPDA